MIIPDDKYDRVDRILLQGWWYSVVPGSLQDDWSDPDRTGYLFDHVPRGALSGATPKSMQVISAVVEGVQYTS